MSQKIIILFILATLFIFGISYIPQTTTPTQNNIATTTVTTSTEQIILAKPTTTTPASPSSSVKATKDKKATLSKLTATTTVIKVKTPQIITIPEPAPNFEAINTFARQAIVNILCTTINNTLSPISGTGVIINSDGLILTNAHVAQFFLLRDLYQKDFVDCVIRTGSPAYPRYHAELVYISPAWVENNKTEIKSQNPTGTGERDFAFLRITDSINASPLPKFPFITPDVREKIDVGEPVILVSYPAGFLGGLTILQNLNITSAITTVQGIFTFKENTIDTIGVGGTVISQKGASGGAVVDKNSSLIGIISTSSNGDTTSSRDLDAITLAYINRTLQSEIGMTLPSFLSQDLASFAKNFQENVAPALTKLLTDEITKNQ